MAGYRSRREVGATLFVLQAIVASAAGLTYAQGGGVAGNSDAARGAAGTQPVCVDVEIDGVRTLPYDCLSRQLTPSAAVADGAASQSAAEALAKGPSNQVGTFNLSAEHNRFGANWGKSAFPQRPPPLQVVPIGR